MKKLCFIGILFALTPSLSFGDNFRINKLVQEKQRKMAELEKCMGSTKGLKIAGISTLGLTAVGVVGNVAEAKKINEYDDKIESTEKSIEKTQKQIDETRADLAKQKAEAEEKKRQEELKKNCEQSQGTWKDDSYCVCGTRNYNSTTGKCEDVTIATVQLANGGTVTGVLNPATGVLTDTNGNVIDTAGGTIVGTTTVASGTDGTSVGGTDGGNVAGENQPVKDCTEDYAKEGDTCTSIPNAIEAKCEKKTEGGLECRVIKCRNNYDGDGQKTKCTPRKVETNGLEKLYDKTPEYAWAYTGENKCYMYDTKWQKKDKCIGLGTSEWEVSFYFDDLNVHGKSHCDTGSAQINHVSGNHCWCAVHSTKDPTSQKIKKEVKDVSWVYIGEYNDCYRTQCTKACVEKVYNDKSTRKKIFSATKWKK